MFLTRQHKLLPTKAQHRALEAALMETRRLYNGALEERISAWRHGKISINGREQYKSLTLIRGDEDHSWGKYPAVMGRWPLSMLDKAFQAFFSRLNKNGKVGFPRFRSETRFHSFGLLEWAGAKLEGVRIYVKGLGRIRIHDHRELPANESIRGCTFTRRGRNWTLQLQIEIDNTPRLEETPDLRCAVDWGIENALTLDDGFTLENLRVSERHQKAVDRAHRAVSRARRGSKNRRKRVSELKVAYRKTACVRTTRLHQVSAAVVARFPFVAVENLQIKNMTASAGGTLENPGKNVAQKRGLNKAILDCAPGRLVGFIHYKAERAGGEMRRFDPRNTTQNCAACNVKVPKTMSDRWHECSCGWSVHRDVNAACNGYKRTYKCDAPMLAQWRVTHGGVVAPGSLPTIHAWVVAPETSGRDSIFLHETLPLGHPGQPVRRRLPSAAPAGAG